MRVSLARAMLGLATLCMATKHHAWGLAMQAELEEAIEAGKPLRFALGCLAASLCRMPTHEEGRFSLTAHGLAIGLMVPLAALQIGGTVLGISHLLHIGSFAAAGSLQAYFLAGAYRVAIPLLAILTLLLGLGHLRMAWMLLERDWRRVETMAAFTLAAAMTSIVLIGLLDFDIAQALRQCAIVLIELAGLAVLGLWHTELPERACIDLATG
jgi:hypothetical protein